MVEVDKGHRFLLNMLDIPALGGGWPETPHTSGLVFVKRCEPPEKFPGNKDAYPGTTSQEVLRALIARARYVQWQAKQMKDILSVMDNEIAIQHYQTVILLYERRAARRHGRKLKLTPKERKQIETLPTCSRCGHLKPETHEECRP